MEQLKPVTLLAVFLMGWWLLPLLCKRFARASFNEFQAPFNHSYSHLADLQTYWQFESRSKKELIEAGRDMSRQLAYYTYKNQQNSALQAEIHRLEKLLNLPSKPEYRYEVARVTKRELNAWWQQITVRKGRNDSIPVGAAVVYAEGVVGRVSEVRAYESVIELVSSPGFRMAANIENEERPVTYQGFLNPPFSSPLGQVMNIPPEIRLNPLEPRRLVSSPLGGIFPEGLTIGMVTALEPGPDGFFQKGTVRLSEDLSALQEVAIVIPIMSEGSDPLVE